MDIRNTNCAKCPELVKSRRRITWGYGNENSEIVFIGEALGRFGCDITGIPFTKDRSGKLFQDMICTIGLTKEDVYTTNVVKCCPPKNRTPTIIEIGMCAEYLRYELSIIKPKYLVLLGASAMQIFFPAVESITKNWDIIMPYRSYQCILLPHPAFICRNESGLKPKYIESFKKIGEKIGHEQIRQDTHSQETWF